MEEGRNVALCDDLGMASALRTIDGFSCEGKRVLVRVDFNVTIERERIVDDFRIRAAIPTIRELKRRGAKAVVLLSHLGRPDGYREDLSLRPIAATLSELLGEPVSFVEECVGAKARMASAAASEGAVLLFENLRFHPEEERNDPAFASALAELGDAFVNDAFGASHRAHASVVGITAFLPSAAGKLLVREVEVLTKVREHPDTPFVAVMGGAKISDKLPILARFLPRVSALCVGGALANTILKARGVSLGASLVEDAMLEEVSERIADDPKLLLPSDAVVSQDPTGAGPVRMCDITEVRSDEFILDIGPKTRARFAEAINGARMVFWNGPMGRAEVAPFRGGTDAIAFAVANAQAFSVVGGGDTTRYPLELGLADRIGFLSTGGGAMLEFLSGKPLPGIEVLISR